MVVFSRQCANAIKCLKVPSRTFYTSSSTFATTKTVKKFGELPTAFLQPDGTPAPPLEGWWGGPDGVDEPAPRKSRKLNREPPVPPVPFDSLSPDVSPPDKADGLQASKPLKRIRNTRARSAADETRVPEEVGIPAMTPEKPKRNRRTAKKAIQVDPRQQEVELSIEGPGSSSLPSAENSTKVVPPGRIRRREIASKAAEETTEVPQGLLAHDILSNLERFPHCILLTRVGQFYESYFDQAIEVARLLGIKLTSRKWGGRRIPMCGFPLMHLDKHLKTLVQQNDRFVAMCEEFPEPTENGTKSFTRRVTRVITPGTLIDEPFLNPYENNYLLAISTLESGQDGNTVLNPGEPVGLAWIDVSTGEFFSKASSLDNLQDELARIGPREVVLDQGLRSLKDHPVVRMLSEDSIFVSFTALPKDQVSPDTPPPTGTEPTLSSQETSAISLLAVYLRSNLMEHMPALISPKRDGLQARMQIDSHTIKALEIRENYREGGVKGSLLSSVKRTVTTGGTRLLARWLCSPSTSVTEINARQSLVALFFTRPHLRDDLTAALAEIEDISRVVQKFVLGRGSINDLQTVRKAVQMWAKIFLRIEQEKLYESRENGLLDGSQWASMDTLLSRAVNLQHLLTRIQSAVDEQSLPVLTGDPQAEATMGGVEAECTLSNLGTELGSFWRYGSTKWSIKPTFSQDLIDLHSQFQSLLDSKEQLERQLQLAYDAPSLTLRASPAQGMHVHLAKGKRDQSKLLASDEFVSIAESGSTRCFFHKEWSLLGGQIADITLALTVAEKEAFEILRNEITSQAPLLRRNAEILDEIDVALAYANLAAEMKFVRPVLTERPEYKVANGRHPTVELGLLKNGRVFTPNSTSLTPDSMMHVITGPNMAGKSTYLRQTALTVILAQTGSFVPADSATLGIVDKLFSRIGAKDDLFHDRSTFMVEMLETADILRRATPRSLVIMDEVGRGTTMTDGLAIAYATIHHLTSINQCRSLFATHFHELADMLGFPKQHTEGPFSKVDFFCTDVTELEDGYFAYQYRVRPGINRDSHGIKVAQLAGMPLAAIQVAKQTLEFLRMKNSNST